MMEDDAKSWMVVRVLEPKDPLISKGMRGTAKLLKTAGYYLAVLETSPGPGGRYALGTVPKRHRETVASVLCGLSEKQFNEYMDGD